MAVNTRDRRMSMVGLASPVPSVLPTADGSISPNDRAMFLWLYYGIELRAKKPGGVIGVGRYSEPITATLLSANVDVLLYDAVLISATISLARFGGIVEWIKIVASTTQEARLSHTLIHSFSECALVASALTAGRLEEAVLVTLFIDFSPLHRVKVSQPMVESKVRIKSQFIGFM